MGMHAAGTLVKYEVVRERGAMSRNLKSQLVCALLRRILVTDIGPTDPADTAHKPSKHMVSLQMERLQERFLRVSWTGYKFSPKTPCFKEFLFYLVAGCINAPAQHFCLMRPGITPCAAEQSDFFQLQRCFTFEAHSYRSSSLR